MFDKPCNFYSDTASVWLRLDGGRGTALYLCARHNDEMIGLLVDLQQVECPECGTTIHLGDPDPDELPLAAMLNEAQKEDDA